MDVAVSLRTDVAIAERSRRSAYGGAAPSAVAFRLPEGEAMSQKSVEIILGKLATDEELRERFRDDAAALLRALVDAGLALTRTEVTALLSCGGPFVDAVGAVMDSRLVKASLRPERRPDRRGDAPSIGLQSPQGS